MWNQDLLEQYEPKKMAKSLVIAHHSDKKAMPKLIGILEIFEPHEDGKKFASDIAKHKESAKKRIEWI
jgi:hypothetical protein